MILFATHTTTRSAIGQAMDEHWKEILLAIIGLGVVGLVAKVFVGIKKSKKSNVQKNLRAGGDIAGRDVIKKP